MAELSVRFTDIKDNMQLMESYGIKFNAEVKTKYNETIQSLNLLH